MVLERWSAPPWSALLRSRLTHPRSASLAERHWNLLCHLRAHGVGTPQPLAVGASGAGLVSRRSFLVTREVAGYSPLPDWLDSERRERERRRGLRAVGALLARLFDARVFLPRLALAHLALIESEPDSGPDAACSGTRPSEAGGLRRRRNPSVVLTEVEGGEIRGELAATEIAAMLRALDQGARGVAERDRWRAARGALANLSRERRLEVRRRLSSR